MKTDFLKNIIAGATVILAISGTQHTEARMNKALNDTASTGMNALDYRLQRPLGNPVFKHKRFGDHFFLSGGAGVSIFDNINHSGLRPGLSGEISFGDWVTPVHGWRVTINGGTRSKTAGTPWTAYGALGADYLVNFSNLLRGYNPKRRVEAIGAIGAEYRRMRQSAIWGNALGLRAALQLRFNVQDNLYLYAEPRLGLYAGTRYPDDSFHRFHYDLSFNLGMGYRLLSKRERMARSTPFYRNGESHLFFGVGGGIWAFARKATSQARHPFGFGGIYAGKYFSSTAGLRIKADFGRIDHLSDPEGANRYLASGGLDFVWNLNSAFGGYCPDDVFDMSLNFGPAVAYADKTAGKFYPGAEASLTALFRLSDNWGIFIEPEARIFTRKFNTDVNAGGYGPIISVMAGLRYSVGNFKFRHPDSYNEYLKENNSFLTFAVAPAFRFRGDYGTGASLMVGFGRRYSPISSWRVSFESDVFNSNPDFITFGVSADYLFSISTSMAGFNPDRVFDLSGLIGITGGAGEYKDSLHGLIGGRVGLHGDFRLSDALDLYLEPQAIVNNLWGAATWTPEMRLMVGLKYRLGNSGNEYPSRMLDAISDGRNFVSLSGGPSALSTTFLNYPHKIGGSADISIGRWFTRVSGIRAGYNLDIISTGNPDAKRPVMNTLHADYMLNVTSLMDRNPARRFHIIGVIGAGLAFSNLEDTLNGPSGEAGIQFRYNLPDNIDIHIEPNLSFYPNRTITSYASPVRMVGVARLMCGLGYRF